MIGSYCRRTSRSKGIYRRCTAAAALLISLGFSGASYAQEAASNRPGAIRTSGPGPRRPSEILGQSLSLSAAILATGGIVLLLGRRFQAKGLRLAQGASPANFSQKPRVTSRVRLTNRQMVHVVQLGDRVLLLGTGSQDAPVLLAQWDDPAAAELHDNSSEPIENLRVAPIQPDHCTAPTAVSLDRKEAAA